MSAATTINAPKSARCERKPSMDQRPRSSRAPPLAPWSSRGSFEAADRASAPTPSEISGSPASGDTLSRLEPIPNPSSFDRMLSGSLEKIEAGLEARFAVVFDRELAARPKRAARVRSILSQRVERHVEARPALLIEEPRVDRALRDALEDIAHGVLRMETA